jgi:hypothetical protein
MSCTACADRRRHTDEDWANHPLAGHGRGHGQGWCCAAAEEAHRKEAEALRDRAIAEARALENRPTEVR